MQKLASKILDDFKDQRLIDQHLGPDATVTGIAPIDGCQPGDLSFVDKEALLPQALKAKPTALVTTETLAKNLTALNQTAILTTGNVRLAQALITQAYIDNLHEDRGWPPVHPNATIHPSVQLPDDVRIGPGVVIERNVTIGSGCSIHANAVIEYETSLGENCLVHPNVTIGHRCQIGHRCMLHSGAVIGMEGYGYAQDDAYKSHRIPQIGRVVIEEDVRIGANCAIDRGTFGDTHLGPGVKLDDMVHIAHNCKIGADCLLISSTIIAGSSTLGKRVITSGHTAISDHVNICDDVILLRRAGVTDDITEPGAYAGHPLQPLRDFFKSAAVHTGLPEMKKRLAALEKSLQYPAID